MRAWLPVLLLLLALPARAAEPVDLALVLVTDVSRSIDDSEYDLEKHGTGAAFRDPRVLAAIRGGSLGRIAVAYVEFAGAEEVATVVEWRVIAGAEEAGAFGDAVVAAPRSFRGRTSISAGMAHAMELLAAMPFEATRRVIDVCGDGTSNNGEPVDDVRDRAVEAGIVVNGLAIINDHPAQWNYAHVQPPGGLDAWYRAHVTGGDGAFVLVVHDFASFGAAMARKLISEIAAAPAPGGYMVAGFGQLGRFSGSWSRLPSSR